MVPSIRAPTWHRTAEGPRGHITES